VEAKRAVAACLGLSGAEFVEVEIRADADGAPAAVVGDVPAPVSISLSHRAGAPLCAARLTTKEHGMTKEHGYLLLVEDSLDQREAMHAALAMEGYLPRDRRPGRAGST
jgi:hypothetical protein